MITPTGQVSEYSNLDGIAPYSEPYDIMAGPDGNLWFTQQNSSQIGRITPAGQVTEFSTGITPHSGPNAITVGPDGNLWLTEADGNIGRLDLPLTGFPVTKEKKGPPTL